jgi:hypothetical protein
MARAAGYKYAAPLPFLVLNRVICPPLNDETLHVQQKTQAIITF